LIVLSSWEHQISGTALREKCNSLHLEESRFGVTLLLLVDKIWTLACSGAIGLSVSTPPSSGLAQLPVHVYFAGESQAVQIFK
jgi:hypothetical protein